MRNCLKELETITKPTQEENERANCIKGERASHKIVESIDGRKKHVKIRSLNIITTLKGLNNKFIKFQVKGCSILLALQFARKRILGFWGK